VTLWLNATEAPLVHRKSTPDAHRLVVRQRIGKAVLPDEAAAAHRLRGGDGLLTGEGQSWVGVLAGGPVAPALAGCARSSGHVRFGRAVRARWRHPTRLRKRAGYGRPTI
jgi:hypothetical protein